MIPLQVNVLELGCQHVSTEKKLEKTVTGFDCTKCRVVLQLSTWYNLNLHNIMPFYCPVNSFFQTTSVCRPSGLSNFVFSTWPQERPSRQSLEASSKRKQESGNVFEHYCEACGKFTKEFICQGRSAVVMDTGRERH